MTGRFTHVLVSRFLPEDIIFYQKNQHTMETKTGKILHIGTQFPPSCSVVFENADLVSALNSGKATHSNPLNKRITLQDSD